jgi:hypothetical protein
MLNKMLTEDVTGVLTHNQNSSVCLLFQVRQVTIMSITETRCRVKICVGFLRLFSYDGWCGVLPSFKNQ